jgi:hypothetical protein
MMNRLQVFMLSNIAEKRALVLMHGALNAFNVSSATAGRRGGSRLASY